MVHPIWERLKAGNKYVYTLVNKRHLPVLFDSNTGTFRVYTSELIRGYIITRQFNKIKDIPNELLDLYNNTINDTLEEIYL